MYEAAAEGARGRDAFHSGFVAIPRMPVVSEPRDLEVEALMSLQGGRQETVRLASLRALPGLPLPREAARARFPALPGPRVAICMATFNPPQDLLRRQLDSIREQSHGNWVCLISDESSDEAAFEQLRAEVEGDERFVLSRNDRHLGFYRNFERAMSMTPKEADFVALCDQDDSWHPDKLERLLEAIGDALLVYSDARLVSPRVSWSASPTGSTDATTSRTTRSLVMANSVTGAASLFRRELLDDALPLPPYHYKAFHDHWLAAVALSLGRSPTSMSPSTTTCSTATPSSGTRRRTGGRGGARTPDRAARQAGQGLPDRLLLQLAAAALTAEVLKLAAGTACPDRSAAHWPGCSKQTIGSPE